MGTLSDVHFLDKAAFVSPEVAFLRSSSALRETADMAFTFPLPEVQEEVTLRVLDELS